uniref:TAR DNA-binding protein 43 N-terminal domain-containing protein n=1 Tax=Panagrolaimus sp. PS1159 TaxID=55785 RepID=A0AC35GIC1_9BILA
MAGDVVKTLDSQNEEKYVKLKVQGHSQLFEVPLESNGNLSFSDLQMILPNAMALIIEYHSVTRLLKPKNEYFNQPKEGWENVLISVVLNEQTTNIRSTPLPSISNAYVFDSHESLKMPASNEDIPTIKTETSETNGSASSPPNMESQGSSEHTSSPSPPLPSQVVSPILNSNTTHEASLSPSSIVAADFENAISKEDEKEEGEIDNNDDEEIISDQSGPVAAVNLIGLNQGIIGVPTFNDIYDAYNVFSTKDLRELLCRGNPFYNKTFDAVTNIFRKTLVTYPPNNDIVRLLHYAMQSDLLFKEINSNAHEDCELCGAKLTLEHLLSAKHVKKYKAVYHNEPPEVLTLLEPKNYALYIHPDTLNNLKIDVIKEMEKSPEFSSMKCLQNFKQFFALKYKLIRRILEANFEISHKETFSIDKIFFLRGRTNNPALCEIFANLYAPYDCYGYLVQFGMICLILSFIKETQNGYCFLPKKHLNTLMRKRPEPSTSSSNVNAKRRKLE